MNTSDSLERLSDVLLGDEQIVTMGEREFLADLLRRSENHRAASNPAITQAIAQIAGEIVAQRACGLVGDHIMRRLTGRSHEDVISRRRSDRPDHNLPTPRQHMSSMPPMPPAPLPPTPGPRMSMPPIPPAPLPPTPGPRMSMPPMPPAPEPPTPGPRGISTAIRAAAVSVLERPDVLPLRYAVMEELLAPAELNGLLSYTLGQEREFKLSEVVSPGVSGNGVNFEYRRSRVLMDLGRYHDLLVDRLRLALPRLLPRLEMEPFPISGVDVQITASNDGDFFHWHSDNAQDEVASRHVTFVYFFHREPKMFEGGELRLYDSRKQGNGYVPAGNYLTIVPQQNQAVLFNSSLAHEITPVVCGSQEFADSRFTVNGWFCR
jgi:SM-20-related protein